MEEDKVEAGGGQEEEQEEVPQDVDGHQGVGMLLAGEVTLQQRELEVAFPAGPGDDKELKPPPKMSRFPRCPPLRLETLEVSPLVVLPETLGLGAGLLDLPHVLH